VAALDFHAFYGDIVAYNVGLPGADNYPLGGTPGFGFANFLIYFGRVASLRDYFPFGVFYVLLVPLGLLLAHRQLREGTPVAALLTGTGALVASRYLSRVVHPNYLVPAAILLPLALVTLRRAPDVALVPLALLAVAVETVTNGVFREAWQEAVATGHAALATGLPAWLLPRASPALTDDPLGLLFGALAAGLAVVTLVAGVLRAPPRVRAGLIVVAAVLVIGIPALVVARIGERTGVPRAQDAWVVQAWADAGRLAEGRSPYSLPPATAPRGREAWSSSFRAEPAKELLPDRPWLPPGAATLGRWLWPFGLRDPRPLVLAALALLALLMAWASTPGQRPLDLGLALLLPPLAIGTVFGSPSALSLAGLLGASSALWAGRRRNDLGAGIGAGVAAGFDHHALLAAPLLLWSGERWRAMLGLGLGYAMLVVPAILPDPPAFAAAFVRGFTVEPGVGLANFFLYVGGQRSRLALAMFAAAPVLAALLVVCVHKAATAAPLAAAALVILAGLWLSPSVSPEALAVPIVLAALAARPAEL
jgi:hypothetical protein